MGRNPEHQFVSLDPEEIVTWMTEVYETMTKQTVMPGSPEQLFIRWAALVVLHERNLLNWAGNQNIPSRAEGANLDALSELCYEQTRPAAQRAVCTVRFEISEPQNFAVLIPAGTRVTDVSGTLVWQTTQDHYVGAGESYVDAKVTCQTAGAVGNGYAVGQICKLVDLYGYYSRCANITASDGGADEATDEEFYELMRLSMDGYSTAGGTGNYIYHAKRVSTEIADVCANSPTPGTAYLYVLMDGGVPAGEEIKQAVYAACSPDNVRPFTDLVVMGDPLTVAYDIDLTYYVREDSLLSSADLQDAVEKAVDEYAAWQCGKLGRDINPSKLHQLLMQAGVKRVELRSPVFRKLEDGKRYMGGTATSLAETIPQVAMLRNRTVLNGGTEDE